MDVNGEPNVVETDESVFPQEVSHRSILGKSLGVWWLRARDGEMLSRRSS